MSRDSVYQQLRSHLAYLKLSAAAEALPEALEQARDAKTGHTEFVEQLLAVEVEATEQRRLNARMRFANFPAPWTITDFDFTAQPAVDEAMIRELGTCGFLDDATNVLFIGPPGVGKTMLEVTPEGAPIHVPRSVSPQALVYLEDRARMTDDYAERWAAEPPGTPSI